MSTTIAPRKSSGPSPKSQSSRHASRSKPSSRPSLAVWKFASCDGCQLTVLDCEDELLEIANVLRIAYFPEASSRRLEGPYDVSLIEGSVSAPGDIVQLRHIRENSRYLVAIGACATAGGIQALRNFGHSEKFLSAVYASPQYIESLSTATPAAHHVKVDFELQGCPINKSLLLEILAAFIAQRRPRVPRSSVCVECKSHGVPCIVVAQGIPCLGPITQGGCGALCPQYHRGCYSCFGPKENCNPLPLLSWYTRRGEKPPIPSLKLFYASHPSYASLDPSLSPLEKTDPTESSNES